MEDYSSISVDSQQDGDLVNSRLLRVDQEGLTNVIGRIYEVMLTQVFLSIIVLTVCINMPVFTHFLTQIGGVVIILHLFLCFFSYYLLDSGDDRRNLPLVSLLTCSLDLCFAAFGIDLMREIRKEVISLAFVLVALIFYILKKADDGLPISYYNAKIISAVTAFLASFAIHFYYLAPDDNVLDLLFDMIRTCCLTLIYVFNLLYFSKFNSSIYNALFLTRSYHVIAIDNPYTIQKYYPDRIVEGLVIVQFDLFTAIFLSFLSIFSIPFLALIYFFDFILSLFK